MLLSMIAVSCNLITNLVLDKHLVHKALSFEYTPDIMFSTLLLMAQWARAICSKACGLCTLSPSLQEIAIVYLLCQLPKGQDGSFSKPILLFLLYMPHTSFHQFFLQQLNPQEHSGRSSMFKPS